MKPGLKILLLVALSFSVQAEQLITVSAKVRGISAFDFVVREVQRTADRSILNIDNFQSRSAAASRWMMCVYTEIAMARGFSYWAAFYDDHSGDEVILIFPASESPDDAALGTMKGSRFEAKTLPVAVFQQLCGLNKVN